jgi:transposase
VLQVFATQIEQIEAAVTVLEKQLMAWHKSNPCQPALGDNSWHRSHYRSISASETRSSALEVVATAIAAMVAEPSGFRSGREFAAWLGLVPRQNSTGGKNRLGGISKRGNQYLRRLLINGASANLLRPNDSNQRPSA